MRCDLSELLKKVNPAAVKKLEDEKKKAE